MRCLNFGASLLIHHSRNTALPLLKNKKDTSIAGVLFWRSSRDLNPGTPSGAYEISSHASSTT